MGADQEELVSCRDRQELDLASRALPRKLNKGHILKTGALFSNSNVLMTALGMFDGAESNGINFIYVIIVASEAERSEASTQS